MYSYGESMGGAELAHRAPAALWELGAVGSAYASMRGLGAPSRAMLAAPAPGTAAWAGHPTDGYGRPLLPEPLGGAGLPHPHANYYGAPHLHANYQGEDRGGSRSASAGRSPRRDSRPRSRRRDAEEDADDDADGGEDQGQVAARVDSIESELRSLIEGKEQRDAQVQDQITHALTLASKVSEEMESLTESLTELVATTSDSGSPQKRGARPDRRGRGEFDGLDSDHDRLQPRNGLLIDGIFYPDADPALGSTGVGGLPGALPLPAAGMHGGLPALDTSGWPLQNGRFIDGVFYPLEDAGFVSRVLREGAGRVGGREPYPGTRQSAPLPLPLPDTLPPGTMKGGPWVQEGNLHRYPSYNLRFAEQCLPAGCGCHGAFACHGRRDSPPPRGTNFACCRSVQKIQPTLTVPPPHARTRTRSR